MALIERTTDAMFSTHYKRFRHYRRRLRTLTFAIAFFSGSAAAIAAEPVFPQGSHFGLVPPPGFVESPDFMGFMSTETGGSILINELPREAFESLKKTDLAAGLARSGVTVETQSSIIVGKMNAIRITGYQTANGTRFTKCALFVEGATKTATVSLQIPEVNAGVLGAKPCASLSTLAQRADAGADRPLPYELSDMGGMRDTKSPLKGAKILTIGPKDTVKGTEQPLMIIVSSLGAVQGSDHGTISKQALQSLRALSNPTIVSETSLQIDGAPGYEIVASGTYSGSRQPIAVVQWMRFADNRYIRLVGIAAAARKDAAFAAFHKVRNGLRAR